jgi:hypothetical protein
LSIPSHYVWLHRQRREVILELGLAVVAALTRAQDEVPTLVELTLGDKPPPDQVFTSRVCRAEFHTTVRAGVVLENHGTIRGNRFDFH